jgi:hypothetical protein
MKRILGLSLVAVLTSLSMTALADGAAAAPAKASPKTSAVTKAKMKGSSAPAAASNLNKPGATVAKPKVGPAAGGSAKMEGGE